MEPTEMQELTDIGRRINECFFDVKTNMTTDDLDRIEANVNRRETLAGGSGAIGIAKKRIAALRAVCMCP